MLLSAEGYLVYRLTGEATLDIYDAGAYAPLFDVQTLTWNRDLAEIIAAPELLPRLTWTCAIAGAVTREASGITGLAAGTPIITGTADAAAEAISAGLARQGDLMVMYGSSIFFILRTNDLHHSRQFWGTRFLEPGSYAVAGGMSTAGSLTRWFRDNFAPEEMAAETAGGRNAYVALAELAAAAPRGDTVWWCCPTLPANARRCLTARAASFAGLRSAIHAAICIAHCLKRSATASATTLTPCAAKEWRRRAFSPSAGVR